MAIPGSSDELRISVPKRESCQWNSRSPLSPALEWIACPTIDELSETASELVAYQQRIHQQSLNVKSRGTRQMAMQGPPVVTKINTTLVHATSPVTANGPTSASCVTPKSAHPGFELKSRLDDQVSPTSSMPNSPQYGRKRADSNPMSQKSSAGSECNIPREFLLRMLAPRGRTCRAMASLPGAMCGWLQPLVRTLHGFTAHKRRYFILANSTLYAFPSNEPNTDYVEATPISNATRAFVSEHGTHVLEIHFGAVQVCMDKYQEMAVPPELKGTARRVMELQCSHVDDMVAWLGAFRDAILLAQQGRTPFPIIEQRALSPSDSPLSPFYALHMRRLTGEDHRPGPRSPTCSPMDSQSDYRRASGSSASMSPHSPRRFSSATRSPNSARSPGAYYSQSSSSPLTSSPASVTSFHTASSSSSHESRHFMGPFPHAVYSGWKEQSEPTIPSPSAPSPRSIKSPTTAPSPRSIKSPTSHSHHSKQKPISESKPKRRSKPVEVVKLDVLDLIEAVNEAKLEKRASKATESSSPHTNESTLFSPTRDKKKKHILPLKIA